jgi:hypothetical protein
VCQLEAATDLGPGDGRGSTGGDAAGRGPGYTAQEDEDYLRTAG